MNNLRSDFKINEKTQMLSRAEMKRVLGGNAPAPCANTTCPPGTKLNVRDLGNQVYECTCVCNSTCS